MNENEEFKRWWKEACEIELFDHETKFNTHHIAYISGFCLAETELTTLRKQVARLTTDNQGLFEVGDEWKQRAEKAEAENKELESECRGFEDEIAEIHSTGGCSYIRLDKLEQENKRLLETLTKLKRLNIPLHYKDMIAQALKANDGH